MQHSYIYLRYGILTFSCFPVIDCEDGSDGRETVDVVGPVQGVEADHKVSLLLGLDLHNVLHLLGN